LEVASTLGEFVSIDKISGEVIHGNTLPHSNAGVGESKSLQH